MPLSVSVQIATTRLGVPHARSFTQWANAAFESSHFGRQRRERHMALAIRIIGATESQRLNRAWRGKDKPTNVLSFPAMSADEKGLEAGRARSPTTASGPPPSDSPLGDLAICAPVVRREAREQGKPAQAHWAHMVVHGVLHLLGYDHENDRDANLMEGTETRVLARLGFPNPYVSVR